MHSLIFKIKDNLGRYTTEAIEDIIDNSKIRDIRLCSGLKDKDGNDICDGDKVEYNLDDDYNKEHWTGKVIFDKGIFRIEEQYYSILRDFNLNCLRVIS